MTAVISSSPTSHIKCPKFGEKYFLAHGAPPPNSIVRETFAVTEMTDAVSETERTQEYCCGLAKYDQMKYGWVSLTKDVFTLELFRKKKSNLESA